MTINIARGNREIQASWIVVLAGVSAALHVGKLPPALIRRTADAAHLNARMGWWGTYMPPGSTTALLLGQCWHAG